MSERYPCVSDYAFDLSTYNEVESTEDLCDLTGYIDNNTYIAQMLEAGEALDKIRRGVYDYDGDDDSTDPEIDPLRAGWTDPSDVDQFANGLAQTLQNKKAAADKAAANQTAVAKASDHEQSYPTPASGSAAATTAASTTTTDSK